MLEQLSKQDKRWRAMALSICQNKELAEDLTNDMYIILHNTGKKYEQINASYIYRVIKTQYLMYLRDKKETCFTEVFNDDYNLILENCNKNLKERELINEALKELTFFEREILLHTSERSLRANEEHFKDSNGNVTMSYRVIHHSKKNALEKLKETETIKEYKKYKSA